MQGYYQRLRPVIESFGGTVEKYIGDAVMAVFGAPVAHEDDPERAVRTGLAIVEAIGELNAADPSPNLAVRVGVNTGEVLVTLGASARGEGEVLGDVVNTAARIQTAAPVNGVAVGVATYDATDRVFEYEQLNAIDAKGKSEPVALWRAVTPRARLGSDVIRSMSTPLVGRELERSLLTGTFERASQQASCQLVTIVGEPGVGKSRLGAELLAYLDERPGLVRWRQGRCLPYGEGIACWALGEIVKAECGILESDNPAQAAAKLARTVPADRDRAWLLARLAPLVGAPAEPAAQEESFAAWRNFCERLAAERTTVLVFEDLHWADPALLAFLEHLADWADGVPLLLLCTARPELYERHPTFGAGARNAQRINLAPLTDTETARLIASLLQRSVLPAEKQQQLLERAGGNPLYAEEFVRLLADRGPKADGVEVPESVQALIAARLDTLPPERKSLLQDASVLGKVFWAGALASMGDRDPGAVEEALHELARTELVRPARSSSMEDEHEYGFWHVLVRDVCYGQIPRAARAARHRAAAAWLEEKAGDRVEDLADVLAHHYQAAVELNRAAGIGEDETELNARAVHYLALAGGRALSLDVDQAERQLAHAIELCPADDPDQAFLLERWAQAVQQQGRLQEARGAFERALELHRARSEPVAAGRVLTRLALVVHRLGEWRSEEMLAEARELLEAQPAGPELVATYAYTAGRYALTGRYPEAAAAAERALALAADLHLPEPAFALHWRGLARCSLGDAGGIEEMRRALQLALEQGLGRETAVIYGNLGWITWTYQGPATASEIQRETIAFCARRGIADVALQNRSEGPLLLAELGQTAQALAEAEVVGELLEATGDMAWLEPRALQLRLLAETGDVQHAPDPEPLLAAAREIALPASVVMVFAAAAQLLIAQARHEQAKVLLLELDQLISRPADLFAELPPLVRSALALGDPRLAERFTDSAEPLTPLSEHTLASARAELAEAARRHADAVDLYSDAAQRWQQFGTVPERAYALLGQGRCLAALGDRAADATLRQARSLFDELGFRPRVAECDTLIETLASRAS